MSSIFSQSLLLTFLGFRKLGRSKLISGVVLFSGFCAVVGATGSCQSSGPHVGSQTNWLLLCDNSDDCGELSCICGVCTISCSENQDCSNRDFGSCVVPEEGGAIAACDGFSPSANLCLARCADESCPLGSNCVADICLPTAEPAAHILIDSTKQYQTLIGIGASLAYDENLIVEHPQKENLFDVMFLDSGFDAIRLGNRLASDSEESLSIPAEIISEATSRLGAPPTLFITSGSPPDSLKANGDRYCKDADPTCTLVRNGNGDFDYIAYGEYWRTSLEAYENVGIHPDYVSIQNHPNWVPTDSTSNEACLFLPAAGTTTMTTSEGQAVDVELPGYDEALAAVEAAVSSLPQDYSFAVAEVRTNDMANDYSHLDPSTYDALAFHLYGMEVGEIDTTSLENLRDLGEKTNKPVIQSEMQANGFDTAIFEHYSFTFANAAVYLQQGFVGQTSDETSSTAIGIDGEKISTLPVYHALAHFARRTAPGWIRIDAASDSNQVLSSAWISPTGAALTVVLINPSDSAIDVQVSVPNSYQGNFEQAEVVRTVFEGTERSAPLGTLTKDGVVRLPARSIMTIAAEGEPEDGQ